MNQALEEHNVERLPGHSGQVGASVCISCEETGK